MNRSRSVVPVVLLMASSLFVVPQTVLRAQGHNPAAGQMSTQFRNVALQFSGTVVDSSGAGIPDASLTIQSAGGAILKAAQSDRNSGFLFAGVTAGYYRLFVSAPNFESREIPVIVGSDQTTRSLRIQLAISTVNTTISVQGRADDLIGLADSSTQGTVGASELATRPILRAGEVLETVPGVIITQHAGGGKANQYFLRGFNLDHGTDFAIFLDEMPLNLPTHAHGEGYSDMNIVIPEFVKRVNYEKGPYYAHVGNYGSAGSAHIEFFKKLPQNFVQVEGGMYGYERIVFGASTQIDHGTLLAGGEIYHDDGPWTHPDNYSKFNGLLSYSQGNDASGVSSTARAYHGRWHSSDQISAKAVPLVGFFGTLDPSGGGHSQRYSMQVEGHHQSSNSISKAMVYAFYYDLDLFSDFTYYLTDTTRGDQFEQTDRRWVAGLNAQHTLRSEWLGRKVENTLGLQLRNDWIRNGLYQSQNRKRIDKVDSGTGNTLPATTQADQLIDTQLGLYAENRMQWAAKFRSVAAVRGDLQRFDVTSLVTSANNGTASKFAPSPKLNLIFGPWASTEVYLQGGFSFHSNDGRGTTQTVQPISGENPYAGIPADKIPPLIPTKGGEIGVRTQAVPHLQSTLSLWYLHSASELQQSGDTGGTTASRQPSDRYGLEFANFYTPTKHLDLDFDLAKSHALFTELDTDDAAPSSPGGKRVPEAIDLVIATGISMHDYKGFSSSLRLRYFGPRDLTSDGIFRSPATALVNGDLGYVLRKKWRVSVEVLNMLNRADHDIDYAYENRVAPTAAASFTNVFHPVEPIQTRFWLKRTF